MSQTPDLSRRSFVTKASLGVAAVGAITAVGPLASKAEASAAPIKSLPDPVVAHVTDLASGKVDIYVGERGFTVTDHTLAQHLARAVTS